MGWVASLVLATDSTVSCHQFGSVLGRTARWIHVGGGSCFLIVPCMVEWVAPLVLPLLTVYLDRALSP